MQSLYEKEMKTQAELEKTEFELKALLTTIINEGKLTDMHKKKYSELKAVQMKRYKKLRRILTREDKKSKGRKISGKQSTCV